MIFFLKTCWKKIAGVTYVLILLSPKINQLLTQVLHVIVHLRTSLVPCNSQSGMPIPCVWTYSVNLRSYRKITLVRYFIFHYVAIYGEKLFLGNDNTTKTIFVDNGW